MATTAAEAHKLGAESFSAGFSSKQNPFTEASEFFAEWSAGWLKAKKAEGDQKSNRIDGVLTAEGQQPDTDYFRKQLEMVQVNLDFYTKAELRRVFERLAATV